MQDQDEGGSDMRGLLGFAMVAAVIAATTAQAEEPVNLAGKWNVLISHVAGGCAWLGEVVLKQTGTELEGEGWAAAEGNANPGCAPMLEGNVAGAIEGRVVQLGFGTGALGLASFRGLILKGDGDMTGWWSTESAGGDWTASRAQQ
jgi:hypothetical protein